MSATKVADFSVPSTGRDVHAVRPPRQGRRAVLLSQGQHARLHHRDRRASATRTRPFAGPARWWPGVSRDSLKSHEGFKAKLALPFELLSDADEKLCTQFDVIRDKKMYGRTVRGIERSTFVIDGTGKLAREWRGVKVPGHVDEVLAFVKSL